MKVKILQGCEVTEKFHTKSRNQPISDKLPFRA